MENQVMLEVSKLSPCSMRFHAIKKLDFILENKRVLSKCEMLDVVADLRDMIDRYF